MSPEGAGGPAGGRGVLEESTCRAATTGQRFTEWPRGLAPSPSTALPCGTACGVKLQAGLGTEMEMGEGSLGCPACGWWLVPQHRPLPSRPLETVGKLMKDPEENEPIFPFLFCNERLSLHCVFVLSWGGS